MIERNNMSVNILDIMRYDVKNKCLSLPISKLGGKIKSFRCSIFRLGLRLMAF